MYVRPDLAFALTTTTTQGGYQGNDKDDTDDTDDTLARPGEAPRYTGGRYTALCQQGMRNYPLRSTYSSDRRCSISTTRVWAWVSRLCKTKTRRVPWTPSPRYWTVMVSFLSVDRRRGTSHISYSSLQLAREAWVRALPHVTGRASLRQLLLEAWQPGQRTRGSPASPAQDASGRVRASLAIPSEGGDWYLYLDEPNRSCVDLYRPPIKTNADPKRVAFGGGIAGDEVTNRVASRVGVASPDREAAGYRQSYTCVGVFLGTCCSGLGTIGMCGFGGQRAG
ncbi:hypothetical protein F4780DRAFT_420588 [Xylariomycetidae sp. FL0641]|nr:hypothetical protein F4780DRAFT_420588 [Xylariomycetidae sp. FL0641]